MTGSVDRLRRTFVRSIVVMGAVAILAFLTEFYLEWDHAGRPGVRELSWAGDNHAKLVDSLSPIARAYNNILAMLMATVGLAVPLTATMHTPKLIELFARDRINRIVLTLMAFGAANTLWVMYMVGPGFAPMWAYRIAVYSVLLGWIVVVPYFMYVVKFLDPSTIVERLMKEAVALVDRAAEGRGRPSLLRDAVEERVFQIGTVIIKSLDRADREVTREGIWALRNILFRYGEAKSKMGDDWFAIDRADYIGVSSAALEMLAEKRTFFETQVLGQLFLSYQAALAKAPDAISAIGKANRMVARNAAANGDGHVVSLCFRFMNSFIREALKRNDTRAVYDVFYQYRELADDISANQDAALEIGRYLLHYAAIAERKGDDFVPQLAVFDLAHVTERAHQAGNPRAGELLDLLAEVSNLTRGALDPMKLKAKLVLAAYFVKHGRAGETSRLARAFEGVPRVEIERAAAELLSVGKRAYWEITDRQVNIEWTPPEDRGYITKFVESLP
ncbi:MAG: DUF2254 domain-containing protein [Sorangiineae bacterium]|nr:DUF2254 domain-containing protein [Polyangiaceae bacterium]MEB2323924.1 DUF2254 domain-containing protein [Sorangiineae bacterium]